MRNLYFEKMLDKYETDEDDGVYIGGFVEYKFVINIIEFWSVPIASNDEEIYTQISNICLM